MKILKTVTLLIAMSTSLDLAVPSVASDSPQTADTAAQSATAATAATPEPVATPVPPAEAQDRLVQGNARFASGKLLHPHDTPDWRLELAKSQHPFAVILGCADSRTAPEVIFDQGLGDLFTVRTAGNVVDNYELGSIEFAAKNLGARLVVVLGHQRCGAIRAARDVLSANGQADGHIQSLVNALRPAVEATTHEDAEATCKANVRDVVQALRSSQPILEPLVQSGQLSIIGAYYSMDTGKVEFLDGK